MQQQKLSAGLASFLQDFESRGTPAIALRRRLFGMLEGVANTPEPAVRVFLRAESRMDLANLPAGVEIYQTLGNIHTAAVPISAIEALSENPAVEWIRLSRFLRPLMDVALPSIHMPQFRANHGGPDGSGVIIGIVDSGVDPNHTSIKGRIVRALDQTVRTPGTRRAGVVLSGPRIADLTDESGHGTHVTAIAAGLDAQFSGVAPKASLVVVKTDFDDANIADGIRFIFEVANELGLPAVVNLSLGGHLDAHDGTDELSTSIDRLSAPGRIVCCAAGNEGLLPIHAQAAIADGARHNIAFLIESGRQVVILNGWYSGVDQYEIAIQSPSGHLTAFQGIRPDGSPVSHPIDGGVAIVNTPGQNAANGDRHFHVQILSTAGLLETGPWALVLRQLTLHESRVDVWNDDEEAGFGIRFTSGVNHEMKIGSPGCAMSAITVGGFTTKDTWKSPGHPVPFQDNSLVPGSLARKSSPGPLRNGARKPDCVAPGFGIVSALSGQEQQGTDFQVAPNFRIRFGTSMATPIVSGLVALLLQQNPVLSPSQAKLILQAASRFEGNPPGTFDARWGFGLIDGALL